MELQRKSVVRAHHWAKTPQGRGRSKAQGWGGSWEEL